MPELFFPWQPQHHLLGSCLTLLSPNVVEDGKADQILVGTAFLILQQRFHAHHLVANHNQPGAIFRFH
jgi:hypothetical protein